MAWRTTALLAIIAGALHGALAVDYHWIFQTNTSIPYSHMSMVVQLPNSRLLAAWQASSFTEGCGDQRILMTHSDDGVSWEVPHVAQEGSGYAVWGPVLHYDETSTTLWLFYSASDRFQNRTDNTSCSGYPRSYPGGSIMAKTSNDGGVTWTATRKILAFESRGQVAKVTANHLLVSGSRWLLPFWQEKRSTYDLGPMCSAVLTSDDAGATWTPYGCLHDNSTWLIENTLAVVAPGKIYQLFRTVADYIYESWSIDNGVTWSNATALSLENPNSKTCLTQSSAGQILAYNPSKSNRTPLSLASSSDGQTWTKLADLETDPAGSFAYPTPIIIGSKVLTSYTASSSDGKGIKLAVFDTSA